MEKQCNSIALPHGVEDFDSGNRRFESSRPSQLLRGFAGFIAVAPPGIIGTIGEACRTIVGTAGHAGLLGCSGGGLVRASGAELMAACPAMKEGG